MSERLVFYSDAEAVLGGDCSGPGHLLSLGKFQSGATQSDFYVVAGPQFIRLISGASTSKAPGEQFEGSREIKGKVFILVDLFFYYAAPGNFLSNSDVCAVQSVGFGGYCDSLCHVETET